jgi:nicotinamide-nucleotide adenylyltransferase
MIKRTMLALDIAPERYDIIPIGFYDSTPSFIAATMSLSPPFQRVYTGNPQIVSLFSSWHYEVQPIHTSKLSGTEVRRKIMTGEKWEHLVPRPVADLLYGINGVQRLKLLSQSIP